MAFTMPNRKSFYIVVTSTVLIPISNVSLTPLSLSFDTSQIPDQKLFSHPLPFGSLRGHHFVVERWNNLLLPFHRVSSESATRGGQEAHPPIAHEHAHRDGEQGKGRDGYSFGCKPLPGGRHDLV